MAEELAADLERMGPTFIKLGQLLSTRADLLPLPYTEALARLQDSVERIPPAEIDRVIELELGPRPFARFDPDPVATASLGQVHRAVLPDGRAVAVKVQRPGIRERLLEDLDALGEIAAFLDRHSKIGRRHRLTLILEEFRRSLLRELDYRAEAGNLERLAQNLREFDRIVVPRPVADFTTGRVLTMEFVEGRKVTQAGPASGREGLELADQLFRAYLKQMLDDGFLHADPHPGNVLLTPDGRLALLDLGMVMHLGPALQQKLIALLLAISEGNGSEAASVLIDIGQEDDDFDRGTVEREITDLVSSHREARIEDFEVGRLLLQGIHAAGTAGLRFPPEISMVGQTLLKLDHVARRLSSDFRPTESIRRVAIRTMRRGLLASLSMGKFFRGAVELKDFASELPGRLNAILEALARNRFRVEVDAIDEDRLLQGLQKIANRITLGLVLAALIVGAALLSRVEARFRILGYPGLSIILFLLATIGAAGLSFSILLHDRRTRSPHR
jgi:predicted unusual protein kinase regulating ubiquinone biosynthesis (AarF/ABC1/UbiB family)